MCCRGAINGALTDTQKDVKDLLNNAVYAMTSSVRYVLNYYRSVVSLLLMSCSP